MKNSIKHTNLYLAILNRRSVRRYDRTVLDQVLIDQVQHLIVSAEPLITENHFDVRYHDGMLIDRDFISSMGAYGYIVSPPHAIAPYIIGNHYPLVDLGYRVEQIVVKLTELGIGTCYIGTLYREEDNRARLDLPADSRCGALLVFGYPASSATGRTLNSLMRSVPRGNSRLPLDLLFHQGSFDHPTYPTDDLLPILNAARSSPSAVNAQPWRFLWHEGELHIFVKRYNQKYGLGPGQAYRYYDGGICLANIKLAMNAQELEGEWILPNHGYNIPSHPSTLEPLAKWVFR
ncbi:MAG: nitroreductase family protein [Anaerolineaceae bacterium]|nr:MAG: nitroreductase family protein [Anaerolineaceae bacterium]